MVSAQIIFKFAGNYAAGQIGIIGSLVCNPWLWAGLLCSGAGMVCWLLVLRTLSLATAYPWTALIYVFTPLASALVFNDVLNGKYVIGMVCIVAGVFFTTWGTDA